YPRHGEEGVDRAVLWYSWLMHRFGPDDQVGHGVAGRSGEERPDLVRIALGDDRCCAVQLTVLVLPAPHAGCVGSRGRVRLTSPGAQGDSWICVHALRTRHGQAELLNENGCSGVLLVVRVADIFDPGPCR